MGKDDFVMTLLNYSDRVIVHRMRAGITKSSIEFYIQGGNVFDNNIELFTSIGTYMIPITNVKYNEEDVYPEFEVVDGDDTIYIELAN